MMREIKIRITDGKIPKQTITPKEKLMNFLIGTENKTSMVNNNVRRENNVKDVRTFNGA